MMKKVCSFLLAAVALVAIPSAAQSNKQFNLQSPNGKLEANISVGKTIEYSISHKGDLMLAPSQISMTLGDGRTIGTDVRSVKSKFSKYSGTIDAHVYKRQKVEERYNQLVLTVKDYSIVFRAYDQGIAYRFVTNMKSPFIVMDELAEFNFPADRPAYIPYANRSGALETQYINSFEAPYDYKLLSEWNKERLGINPLLVEGINDKKVAIAEADLINYPGMFLYPGDKPASIKGVFAPYPKTIVQGGHNMLQGLVKEREAYIAKCEGKSTFPWRIVIVSTKDRELADNDMVFLLATPADKDTDYSWVKPGKVAWEWWNNWGLYGVDFKAGVNNNTYKYYIDFASQNGIEYVILDEGWAVNKAADLLQVVPQIDLKELVAYGTERNVGLILWAGYWALNRDIEGLCKHYSEMGIKGFKVDFMDRDDQPMVDFHYRTAEIAAKYKLLIDYHGSYKPTGLQRTFPNVINFEGVNGLEQMKWSGKELDQITYDVTMPFIRMIAGPVDYTQGAMRNATRATHRAAYDEPMSQGTRCRQLAEYIVFDSPLNMLCDSPSNYMREPECLEFIARIPTVWDETIVLNGRVASYITIARRSGDTWYVGSMCGLQPRDHSFNLSFIGEGAFEAEIFRDGPNAGRIAQDYKREVIKVPANRKFNFKMASGGGYVVVIRPIEK